MQVSPFSTPLPFRPSPPLPRNHRGEAIDETGYGHGWRLPFHVMVSVLWYDEITKDYTYIMQSPTDPSLAVHLFLTLIVTLLSIFAAPPNICHVAQAVIFPRMESDFYTLRRRLMTCVYSIHWNIQQWQSQGLPTLVRLLGRFKKQNIYIYIYSHG